MSDQENYLKRNTVIACLFLLLALIFNQFSWARFVDFDGCLYLFEKIFWAIVDLFLVMSGILFLINRRRRFSASYIKIIAFNCLFLFLLLMVFEAVWGNWLVPDRLNQLNIIKDRVIHYDLLDTYPSESDVVIYSRDKWGFRGNYPGVDSIDILTIGGSTTDQRYIPDGRTFQDVLQNEFEAHGQDVSVVNAGIDGQSSFGHIRVFDWWLPQIPDLKVDYYLFYVGVNDFHKDAGHYYDDLSGEDAKTVRGRIKKNIKARSALYDLYRKVEGVVKANAYGLRHNDGSSYYTFSLEDWVTEPKLSDYEEIMRGRLDAYEQRLTALCDRVAAVGSVPIFVTQSRRRVFDIIDGCVYGRPYVKNYDGFECNGVDHYYMTRLLNQRTAQVCLAHDGIFIDLDAELEFDLRTDFYDNAHVTPAGADKIGHYLYGKLNHLF